MLTLIKLPALSLLLLFIFSCATSREQIVRPPAPLPEPPAPPAVIVSPSPEPMPATPDVVRRYRQYIKCGEDTKAVFNSCGIDALPFIRTTFYDVDGDGADEMIAGSKDGLLRLYKNTGSTDSPSWEIVEHYFDGIQVGAFSAPAAGDIDNDGLPEILVGSGGFSTASGNISVYKNSGTRIKPVWRKVDMPELRVGNDAAPALLDVDNDGRPDIIAGNSTGNLFLFRNRSSAGRIVFEKDAAFFKGVKLGMYAAPAATMCGDKGANKICVIAGNDTGKLYILERSVNGKAAWSREQLKISFAGFTSPAFISGGGRNRDLVVSESSGGLHYFRNKDGGYRKWEETPLMFDGRIIAGLACAPAVSHILDGTFMVIGNIDGELKFFEYRPMSGKLPWAEKKAFAGVAKLPGYSRAVLAEWQGGYLLITGQQDGKLRAFLNSGTINRPKWVEQKKFFGSLPLMMHAAPAVFDLDGDGRWELIVGDEAGVIRGFRYRLKADGMPVWEAIPDMFNGVKVGRFAVPSLFRDGEKIYLLSGRQDGKLILFASGTDAEGRTVFSREAYLEGVAVNEHSAPSAFSNNGVIEISVGDYSGNLKHFACRNTVEEVRADAGNP